jgi:hypothetical protein
MSQGKGTGYSIGQAPYMGVAALALADQILSGKLKQSAYGTYSMPLSPVSDAGATQGKTWFPNVSADFFSDVTDTSSTAPVKGLCVAAAKSGASCPSGALTYTFSS